MTERVHRCGTCQLWSAPPGETIGNCEIGDEMPAFRFGGHGVHDDTNAFRTTADSFCDMQLPIPPPGPPCPKCGAPIFEGFGLAGGGYGVYQGCTAEGCDYFEKWECHD